MTTPFQIDRPRLVAAMRLLEEQIRAQKRTIRSSPVPWPENYAAELRRQKAQATLLYAIAAHGRGRLHLRRCTKSHAPLGLPPTEVMTLEEQGRLIGDRWKAFAPAQEAA
jgi:hypothetical protein